MMLELINVTDRLPNENQDVIGFNGRRLVAAKYVKRNWLVSEIPYVTEMRGVFEVEKYTSEGDRSITSYWSEITHWMPAIIEIPE